MHPERETKALPRRAQTSSSFSIISTIRSVYNYFTNSTPLDSTSLSGSGDHSHDLKGAPSDEPSSSNVECKSKRLMYVPHGRWAFVKDVEVTDTATLNIITENDNTSVRICTSAFGGEVIPHIVKRWKQNIVPARNPMFKELALYRLPQFLLPLQGEVVPHIIGVYGRPTFTDVKMELPDSSFWFEASPRMPEVLKSLCIEAYKKLHARGVLHGSVDLRHILISGSGKIQILDFTKSRVKVKPSSPDFGIAKATNAEFEQELRKVMFKLDYQSARSFETSRYLTTCVQSQINQWNEADGLECEYQIRNIPLTGDNVSFPFSDRKQWKEWNADWDRRPLKFEMPGQTPEELDTRWEQFNQWLYDNEMLYWRIVYNSVVKTMAEPPAPAPKRKRKANTAPDDTPSPKRLCSPSPSSSTSTITSIEPQDIQMGSRPSTSFTVPQHATNPAVESLSTEIPSSSDSDDDSDIELLDPEIVIKEEEEVYPVPYVPTTSNIFSVQEPTGLPTSSSCSDPPEPIVRDFINHPFDGPKGFYVPHPPLEARASLQRILWMRAENAARCTQAGLPYKFQVGRIQYGQSGSGGHKHISGLSMGGMKRKQEELEELDRSGHLKNKRRLLIEDHESQPDLGYGTTFLDIRNGRFLSKSEFTKRQGRDKREGKGKGKESAPGLRSILKPTAPVKTLSWKRRAWPSIPETPLSPKMGPEKMAIRMKEPNAVYNSVRDHRLDKKVDWHFQAY
ncbi:hypothetical protein QCA50_001764 [Cerrena zonata]|uniref:Protein kinase domain-containing protein n=1 Tax=Cerrena zonata TaxID=2478898 RepID=A0AAW0GVP1_9APHY